MFNSFLIWKLKTRFLKFIVHVRPRFWNWCVAIFSTLQDGSNVLKRNTVYIGKSLKILLVWNHKVQMSKFCTKHYLVDIFQDFSNLVQRVCCLTYVDKLFKNLFVRNHFAETSEILFIALCSRSLSSLFKWFPWSYYWLHPWVLHV